MGKRKNTLPSLWQAYIGQQPVPTQITMDYVMALRKRIDELELENAQLRIGEYMNTAAQSKLNRRQGIDGIYEDDTVIEKNKPGSSFKVIEVTQDGDITLEDSSGATHVTKRSLIAKA